MGTRDGIKLPRLTCVSCGETKIATRFPKRGGPTYEELKPTNPRRYDTQCKKCKKPVKPGQSRDKVKEPVPASYSRAMKKAAKRKKKREWTPKQKQDDKERRKQIRIETRVQSMMYLASNGCEECGERDPRKLEYDHKDPSTKNASVARLILNGQSWTSPGLRAEIAKCRILCANCHVKHTISQHGYYADDAVQACLGSLAGRYKFDL